jgi:hypothetical protein
MLCLEPVNLFQAQNAQGNGRGSSEDAVFTPFFPSRNQTSNVSNSSGSPLRGSQPSINIAPPSLGGGALGLPEGDSPEIRKYKKRFNTDILCAALWGMLINHLNVYCTDHVIKR